jgi:uncharacterized repeat protein (TIGR01451 family)
MALVALAPVSGLANAYRIIAPPVVGCGAPFWITVVAVDAAGDTKTDYCATTSFTSTDPGALIQGTPMDAYNYTWKSSVACFSVPNDDGVRIFVNVVLPLPGLQTITAVDTLDGSMTDLASITVVCADVKLWGTPASVLAGTNQTVQFRACWSNYSTGSAFTFVVTDAVPMGTTFVPEASVAGLDAGNTAGIPLTVGYSTTASPIPPAPASFTDGNPIAGTRWLRWTAPLAGMATTGCGCFRVRVN